MFRRMWLFGVQGGVAELWSAANIGLSGKIHILIDVHGHDPELYMLVLGLCSFNLTLKVKRANLPKILALQLCTIRCHYQRMETRVATKVHESLQILISALLYVKGCHLFPLVVSPWLFLL